MPISKKITTFVPDKQSLITSQPMDSFWGLPKYVWEGIFTIVEVLLVGGVAGAFIASYQKRKEVIFRVKGEILLKRMAAYEMLEELLDGMAFQLIAPAVRDEMLMDNLLDNIPLQYNGYEYPAFFSSEEKFDEFYKRLQDIYKKNHVYLDWNILEIYSSLQSFLNEVKMILDAYCDTEHTDIFMHSPEDAKRKIDMVYQLYGVLLKPELLRFYALIDQRVAYDLRHLRLSYRDGVVYRWIHTRIEDLYLWAESKKDVMETPNLLARWLLRRRYGNSQFFSSLKYFILVLFRVHCSNKKWENVIANMSEEEQKKRMTDFYQVFMQLYHVR